jgi:hypothetical protein
MTEAYNFTENNVTNFCTGIFDTTHNSAQFLVPTHYQTHLCICPDGGSQKLVSYPKAVGLLALLPNLEFFLFALGTKADLPTIEPFSSYHAASDNDRKTAQQSLRSILTDSIPKPQKTTLELVK